MRFLFQTTSFVISFFFSILLILSCHSNEAYPPFYTESLYVEGVNVLSGYVEESSCIHTIQYEEYQEGENRVAQESFFLEKGDFRLGKIKIIRLQLTENSLFEEIHLSYEPGLTIVNKDSGQMNIYHHTDQRLQTVDYYQKNDTESPKFLQRERFIWQETPSSSRLVSRILENESGEEVFCYCFFYNAQGQLTKETLGSSLSGYSSNSLDVEIGQESNPNLDSIESCSTSYIYSEEDPNS